MQSPSPMFARRESESGYVLLAVIFLTVILLISLAVAAPKIAQSIQREKEIELVHRGEQYKRAIKLYYKKFGAYPTSIDQLVNTNNIRYLRKRYTDPLTGKDDWKPVLFGQAHVRPLGFFGQPLSGAVGLTAAGAAMAGMSGSMYAMAPAATDANGVPVASTDGSSTSTGSAGSGTTGSGLFSSNGTNGAGSTFGSTGSSFGSTGSTGLGSSSVYGSSTSNSPFGSTGSSSGGTSATTFGGGGPIVGVTLTVNKPSLIDYKKQTRYNQWEFNYDPMEDQMQAAAAMMGGGAGIAGGVSPGNLNGASGTPSTGSGAGLQLGSSPTSPTSPTSSSPQSQ